MRFLALLLLWCLPAPAAKLEWDANPEPTVAGYMVHYGTASGTYTSTVDARNTLTAIVPDPPIGVTYFAVVMAYDGNSVESPPSNEVSFTAVVLPPLAVAVFRIGSVEILSQPSALALTEWEYEPPAGVTEFRVMRRAGTRPNYSYVALATVPVAGRSARVPLITGRNTLIVKPFNGQEGKDSQPVTVWVSFPPATAPGLKATITIQP